MLSNYGFDWLPRVALIKEVRTPLARKIATSFVLIKHTIRIQPE